MLGKCPRCESAITFVNLSGIDVKVGMQPEGFKGVAYCCPSCHTVLGCGIDPIAIRTEIVTQIVEHLDQRGL